MTLRFLTGVAIVAAVATGLVKRYRKQLESAGSTLAADAAASTPAKRIAPKPTVSAPATAPTVEPTGAAALN